VSEDYRPGKTDAHRSEATAVAKARKPAPGPNDREKLVSELRRQYIEGTYQVDADSVSSKIVEKHIAK
jgi:anti-sigma28 factor (negative regulator of flagellin synthesis)